MQQVSLVTDSPLTLEDLLPLVEKLPLDEHVALVERILSKQSRGISVLFGNHQLSSSITTQINQMQPEQLGLILNAIATRVTQEKL